MATSAVKKKTTDLSKLDLKLDKQYQFELQPTKGREVPKGNYIVPKKGMCWDDNLKKFRMARLVTDPEASPWLDEQNENHFPASKLLVFKDGKLKAQGYQGNIIKYLLAFDGNLDKERIHDTHKRGLTYRYKLKDEEALFAQSAEEIRLVLKAQGLLANAEIGDLKEFLTAFYSYAPKTESDGEIITVAMEKAQENPEFVIKSFKTDEQKFKYTITRGLKDLKVIKNTRGVITWTETGVEVGKFTSVEKQIVDDLTSWVIKGSKEAKDFYDRLVKEVAS